MSTDNRPRVVQLLQEFSLPLIVGVIASVIFANCNEHRFHQLVHAPVWEWFAGDSHEPVDAHAAIAVHADASEAPAHAEGWGRYFTMHFLVNDLFMVLFFGLAAKEITESCLPGGALCPISRAINPLLGTLGGVVGPVLVYLGLNAAIGDPAWYRGWGIPTATDIALAWLVARMLFGKGHPAISFLLLLAVADDAIGLGIIAFAYPDPLHPTVWANTVWILPGMAIAWTLRLRGVQAWSWYILAAVPFTWWGLYSAHLHPALAMVFVVPFIPGPAFDRGIFIEPADHAHHTSPLQRFEHDVKLYVDCGLFFFAFANAGAPLSEFSTLTVIVALSLVVGKIAGITFASWLGNRVGFAYPQGLTFADIVVASSIAGIGLTVALFVSGQAFIEPATSGAAKMGALLSAFSAVVALALARLLPVLLRGGTGQSATQRPAAH